MLSWQLFSLALAVLTVVVFSGALLSWGESPPLVSLSLFLSAYSAGRASLCAWSEQLAGTRREKNEPPGIPQEVMVSDEGGELP